MSTGATATITLTPAEEKKADRARLLTAFVNLLGVPLLQPKGIPLALC